MKVVAFNGSPKKEGNTYTAIHIVADKLEAKGIEVEIVHVGNKVIRGCIPTFNQLNNSLNYSEMMLPLSNYWSVIHVRTPGEALQDAEAERRNKRNKR